MKNRPKLLIIYTGGTIGMIEEPKNHTLRPFDFDHLIDNVPKVQMLDYDIRHVQFNKPIDSACMNPSHWNDIAKVIESNYESFDGFVVLHGTDTMSYTASALSFMLENLDKPVIITGSQLPIGEVRTDGEENLITALQIAAARDCKGKPMVREVAILFENYLWRGNRSTKRSADNFNAFRSPNYPELAHIGLDITYNRKAIRESIPQEPLKVHYNLSTDVAVMLLYPGISKEIVQQIFSTPGLRGVVLKSYGAGNAPTDNWFIEMLSNAIKNDIVVLNTTQCHNGAVMHNLYETGRRIADCGCIPGYDITTEAAITKLMYLFGRYKNDNEEVKTQLSRSIRGEMTIHD